MEPLWKDAPDWAEYKAMNGNNAWDWFEFEPKKIDLMWYPSGGRCMRCKYTDYRHYDWTKSLEKRPKGE